MSRFCHETVQELVRRGHKLIVLTGHRGKTGSRNTGETPVPPGSAGGEAIRVMPVLNGDLSIDCRAVQSYDAEVDLWHGWEFGFGGLARHSIKPFVVTAHGNDLYRSQAYYRFTKTPLLHHFAKWMQSPAGQRVMCRRSLRRVACFLPNSQNTARLLRDLYPMCRRWEVVHCGVGSRFFQGHEQTEGPLKLLTVCGLSHVRPRKNVVGVLEALAMVAGAFDFRYDICGDGDMSAHVRQVSDSLGLGERVHIHGGVSDEALSAFYRRADLFVLAPYARPGDVEGFGIVYLEANAAGTPVLATRTGGIPDSVRDGVSGFFAASPEPADIARALREFASGVRRFEEEDVRGWAESHRYERVVDKLEAVYVSRKGLGFRVQGPGAGGNARLSDDWEVATEG